MGKTNQCEIADLWVERLLKYLPDFIRNHPILSRCAGKADFLLHGSTTFGIDDTVSDIDMWLLLSDEELAALDTTASTRFFEVLVNGKAGHLNSASARQFRERVCGADLNLIYELRHAQPLVTQLGVGPELIDEARKPMPEELRKAFFFHHYVEMRGDHRACISPFARNDHCGVLLFLIKTVAHAMRAALVLGGEPYPYDKWLRAAALRTSTGREVAAQVDVLFDLLKPESFGFDGPLAEHPLNCQLHVIRETLIQAAKSNHIDEPWLNKWWLYIEPARRAIQGVKW